MEPQGLQHLKPIEILSPWILAILLPVISSTICIYNYYFHPIAHIPGPISAAISPAWLILALHRNRLNHEIQRLHSKYGPVVRIAPNEISFATAEAQVQIYNSGAKVRGYFSKKGTLQSMLGAILWPADNVLTTTDRMAHKRLRNALLPAFTSKALFEREAVQQHHIGRLVQNLDSIATTGDVINLTEYLSALTWNIIGDLSIGEALPKDQQCRVENLKTVFCQLSPLIETLQYFVGLPVLERLVQRLVLFVSRLFRLSTKILPQAKLRECIDRQDGRKDFLTTILGLKENGVNLTPAELMSNSVLLVMVGFDTTASAISAVFYYLLRDPTQMEKLQIELRSRYANSDQITGESLLSLPFLNGCIQEALRLLPPSNGKGTNRTSPGATVGGIFVPAGVNVSADMYTIQRLPEYWAEPEEFRPERWFDHGPGSRFEHDLRDSHRPFLLGPRVCLGRELAMQSLRLTTAKLSFNFDFEMAEKDYNWERDTASSYMWVDFRVMAKLKNRG